MTRPDDDWAAGWDTRPAGPPERDPWVDFALEKVRESLISDEFHFEDRRRTYYAAVIPGALVIVSSIWQIVTSNASHPVDNWQFAWAACGLVEIICAVALAISSGVELKRVRRQLRLVDAGHFPRV